MKKLVLFSSFHPDIGGGGVNFRTQIAGLTGWDITWAYLGDDRCRYDGCRTVCIGKPFIGGPLFPDLLRAPLLWSGLWRKPVQVLARKLAACQPDAFWILGLHEGILLVPELKRLSGIPIHISVQDDQEKGVLARSVRYGWMASLARRPVARALRTADSVDVTSAGMGRYYQSEFGLQTKVTHLAIRQPVVRIRKPMETDQHEIWVGHIGTLYDESVGMKFGAGLRVLSETSGKRIRWKVIGLSPKFKRLRSAFPDLIEDLGALPEPDAVEILAQCAFTYAMYPFQENARVFRMTSFPTKMSTYLLSGRPVFAQTPADSTMAEFVDKFELGIVCSSLDAEKIASDLRVLLNSVIKPEKFETAAKEVFGVKNIGTIQGCLDDLIVR